MLLHLKDTKIDFSMELNDHLFSKYRETSEGSLAIKYKG